MRCRILHESGGRLRVRMQQNHMSLSQADKLQYYLQEVSGVTKVKVNDRTCDAVVWFRENRDGIVRAFSEFDYRDSVVEVPEKTGRELERNYEERLFGMVVRRAVTRFLLPVPLRSVYTVIRSLGYIAKGLDTLRRRKIEVPVLDAVTISTSMLTGDFGTAGSIIFLLDLGELLEEWTHRKSVESLAQRMYLNVDKVWLQADGAEVLVPVNEVKTGDIVVCRMGNIIPLDGVVASGEAAVNQASMTGEALPVRKEEGSAVFAGTVVDEGECRIRVTQVTGSGRYDRIVRMIEESEKLKSETESRAAHLADRLVPWSLGGTALAWFLTRNINKALAILMVDYSCALKLAMPISVLSAMREAGEHHIDVKGGKFMEAVAEADTIVFDKTGTLTHAQPGLKEIVPFGGNDEREMLRLAACLEEHFPHSIANAVVRRAAELGIEHEEMHSKVEYVVAHGIASTVDGKKVRIGSYHFIFEDEGTAIEPSEQDRFKQLPREYSHLYLAIDGMLAAVLFIEDPLRPDAEEVIRELHKAGFSKVCMMTGDSRHTAAKVAAELGLDEFEAEVLPEDKAAFIRREHEKGRKVIMVGDGVNDSPALSEADAGIAIAAGAAIAREVADITISADDLHEILVLRRLSEGLMRRIHWNYRTIMGFNSMLILLGVLGVLPPATAALLHNTSTIAISLKSMTDLP